MCRGGGTTQIKSQPMPLSNILRVVSCPHQHHGRYPRHLVHGQHRACHATAKKKGNPTYQREARIHFKHRVASGHNDNLAPHSV